MSVSCRNSVALSLCPSQEEPNNLTTLCVVSQASPAGLRGIASIPDIVEEYNPSSG
jgi:hypothetical protein